MSRLVIRAMIMMSRQDSDDDQGNHNDDDNGSDNDNENANYANGDLSKIILYSISRLGSDGNHNDSDNGFAYDVNGELSKNDNDDSNDSPKTTFIARQH